MKKLFLYILLFIVVLFSTLYITINSSFVINKVAQHFAPTYNIRYDNISGNALDGITISGLYYKNQKMTNKIRIKINPTTLLEKRVTISLLEIDGIDVKNIEYMAGELASDKANKREQKSKKSSPLPVSIKVNNIHISILPFEKSDIKFTKSMLNIDYLFYANDEFDLGDMALLSQTSLGNIDIKGRFEDGDLHLNSANISDIDTLAIEKMLTSEENTTQVKSKKSKTQNSKPNIFTPKNIIISKAYIGTKPRMYQDVGIKQFDIKGSDLKIALANSSISGKLNISLNTDVAEANVVADIHPDAVNIKSIDISKIDLDKILTIVDSKPDSNATEKKHTTNKKNIQANRNKNKNKNKKIPYLANIINIDSVSVATMPIKYQDIELNKLAIQANKLSINLAKKQLTKAKLNIKLDTNIATLEHTGVVRNNVLHSKISILPKTELIKQYKLPLRDGAIKSIDIDAITNENGVASAIKFKAKRLLDVNESAFNIDISHSKTKVKYYFKSGKLLADTDTSITTPYTKNTLIKAKASIYKSGAINYNGSLSSANIKGVDANISSLLKNLKVTFVGDLKKASVNISSKSLKGSFVSEDLKKGLLHIETVGSLAINNIVKLPKKLKATKARVVIDAPIDLNNTLPLKANIRLSSNILNTNAKIIYGDKIKLSSVNTIPKKSLLKGFDKNLKFKYLSPMSIDVVKSGDKVIAKVASKNLNIATNYNLKSSAIDGNIRLASTNLKVSAPDKEHITISQDTKSLKSLAKSISSIYRMKLPDMSGDLSLKAQIIDLKSASLTLKSNSFLFGKSKKQGTTISNILLVAKGDANGVRIAKYKLSTSGVSLYSNKPSTIRLDGDDINISPLWINDTLKVTGKYNTKSKKGNISADSSGTQINHEMADILTALNVKTDLNGDKISIHGAIHLKGGKLKYNMKKKSFATDGDIVILQRQKKKNTSFEKNFKINLSVDSSKPLVYKKKGISVKIIPNLTIKKNYGSSLRVNGKVELQRGGYYILQNKKFILQRSFIYFKGKPSSPSLDIGIRYKHIGTTINIKVGDTLAEPSLNFSSTPYMNREQILSYILFDTKSGAGQNQTADVTNLVAGTLVKSIMSNIGIKLDHLVLSGTGFEVGKKISDRITVIYNQEQASSVKLKIQNTRSVETDISFGADSQSADIFFKREF